MMPLGVGDVDHERNHRPHYEADRWFHFSADRCSENNKRERKIDAAADATPRRSRRRPPHPRHELDTPQPSFLPEDPTRCSYQKQRASLRSIPIKAERKSAA